MFESTTPTGPVDAGATPADSQLEGFNADKSAEEMWELEEGKNEDGSKKTRKVPISEARKLAQKGFGADKTFQEAAAAREEAKAMKQQIAQLTQMFKQNPWRVMEALGLNPNDLIKSKFERELAESLMDPRDKELRSTKAELEHYRKQRAEAEKQQQESQIQAKVQEYQEMLLTKIDEALKATGVPNNATTVGEIGRYLQSLHGKTGRNGQPINVFEIPLNDIVKHVHSRYKGGFNEIAAKYDDDALLENIDPAVLKRLMAAQTKKLESSGTLTRRNAPAGNSDQFQKLDKEPERKSQKELEMEHAAKIRRLDEAWKKKHGQ